MRYATAVCRSVVRGWKLFVRTLPAQVFVAKKSILLGAAWTLLHIVAHGYVLVEESIIAELQIKKAEAMELLAARYGYERQQTDWDEFDALDVAQREALARGMNPALARAVIRHESGKKQFAVSSKGAIGYMQIMPANYKRCGLKEPGELLDKVKNIRCGIQILDENIKNQKGDLERGLWEYNGGPKAVPVLLKCGHNLKCMGGYDETYFHSRDIINRMGRDIVA